MEEDVAVRSADLFSHIVAGDYVREKIGGTDGNVFFHDIAAWGMESMKETYMKTIRVFSRLK